MDADSSVLVFGGAVLVPLALGFVFSQSSRQVAIKRIEQHLAPPNPDAEALPGNAAEAYRGHAPPRVVTTETETLLDRAELPDAVRSTATLLRVVFLVAMVGILPAIAGVLVDLSTGGLGPTMLLGPAGVALSFGQLSARRGLLRGDACGVSRARSVGRWTFVHNVGVLAVVALATLGTSTSSSMVDAWAIYSVTTLGMVAVVYAIVSFFVASTMLNASKALAAWRAEHDAV